LGGLLLVAVLVLFPIPVFGDTQVSAPPANSGPPWAPFADPGLTAAGFVEEEFFIEGTATAYVAAAPLGNSGVWQVTPGANAPYKTRLLVRRPSQAKRFNGIVIVEWFNVTLGADSPAEWAYSRVEIERGGYAWVGVSAQWGGVASPGPPPIPGSPGSLKVFNPVRYGPLVHPGDSFAYDIFSQAGQALRNPNGLDPLGGLEIETLLATGQSQAAARMVTYVNAIHPLAQVYDGFLVQSRSGGAAALSQVFKGDPGSPLTVPPTPQIPAPNPTLIRADLDEPVLVLQTETDVPASIAARRADDARFRLWEVAGTAHVDAYVLDGGLGSPELLMESICDPAATPALDVIPVNAGPLTYAVRAALRHAAYWAHAGPEPPMAARIETVGVVVQRDPTTGIARGGIRLPEITVPKWTLRGDRSPAGNPFCVLLGRTDPWRPDPWDGGPTDAVHPDPDLALLYPNHGRYVSAFVQAAADSVEAGFLLREDRQEVQQRAVHSEIGK
jgi:hypothetical protein